MFSFFLCDHVIFLLHLLPLSRCLTEPSFIFQLLLHSLIFSIHKHKNEIVELKMADAYGIENRSSLEALFSFDITVNILKMLPVRTLTRFKCVSKDWGKLIESPNFISEHLSYSASNNTFLLQQSPDPPYLLTGPDLEVHISQLIDFAGEIPQFIDFPGEIIGSCNGLLCVKHLSDLFLFNPATRQIKLVPKSLMRVSISKLITSEVIAFGFSQLVNDYKIVKISRCRDYDHNAGTVFVRYDRAEVYSLTNESWKEINIVHLHHLLAGFSHWNQVTANGAMFWKARMIGDVSDPPHYLILSFEIAREAFTMFEGPPQPKPPCTHSFKDILAEHNDKLAVFRRFDVVCGEIFLSCSIEVWDLEGACTVRENWVKKYSVGPFTRWLNPRCFWRDGIVCLKDPKDDIDQDTRVRSFLCLINTYSNEMKSLPVHEPPLSGLFKYAESLVAVGNNEQDP